MHIKQFYDKGLAHASYAIESERVVALIDPGRDPEPYLDFARQYSADILAVFETHPHADFASSHLEFHQKHGATIYVNPLANVSYPHQGVSHGDEVPLGKLMIRTLFTPGHSPDHNSYLLLDASGNPHSIYTGDSLFVGDVGRPDLRESAGNAQMQREGLAKMMFNTVNQVFKNLEDDIVVYPAHGAGSLCGKNLSSETYSTIGQEKSDNWAFKTAREADFVQALLEDQPFVPKYFAYNVDINLAGVPPLKESLQEVSILDNSEDLKPGVLIIDTRPQEIFKEGHLAGAINLQDGGKFETWLGSVVAPDEMFYLIGQDDESLQQVISKAAKIGYEKLIKGALVLEDAPPFKSDQLSLQDFKSNPHEYTIVDIRNKTEYAGGPVFANAHNIPLPELRERVTEIPAGKPIVVHCAGGYRSAAGASIIAASMANGVPVYDLSEAINEFVN